MTKIDWSTAPEWAKYVAMDSSGEWFWFEEKPNCLSNIWLGGKSQTVRFNNSDWKDTLQERPIV